MRRTWIKLWIDESLRGSMIAELTPEQRWIFIGLLLLAGRSKTPGTIFNRNDEFGVPFGYSNARLADELGVKSGSIPGALHRMILKNKITINKKGVINICNWTKYQSEYERQRVARIKVRTPAADICGGTPQISAGDVFNPSRTNAADVSALDREGEGDKEKKYKNTSRPVSQEQNPDDVKLTQLLISLMKENNPESSILKHQTPVRLAGWYSSCRLLRERDGKTPEAIAQVIQFSQDDEFWRSNILSMPKLREQWDQLYLKAKSAVSRQASKSSQVDKGSTKSNQSYWAAYNAHKHKLLQSGMSEKNASTKMIAWAKENQKVRAV